jgi:hypothetical protein
MSSKIIILPPKKESLKKNNISNEEVYKLNKQCSIINTIYLNENLEYKTTVKKEIMKKINSYRLQDLKKKRYDEKTFITYDETIEKLVVSKLKCCYCKIPMFIMYKNKREPAQWTLDRIDNSIGHSNNNCLISCLKCNLEKRTRDDTKFKFTKQMKIIKQY